MFGTERNGSLPLLIALLLRSCFIDKSQYRVIIVHIAFI
jgi:hypothetical protein